MKTFLDAVREAAQDEGWDNGQGFINWVDEDALDVFTKAAEIYLQSAQLQQHSVMQAEGSDGVQVAAVGNSATVQSVSDGVMKWCDSCGKITKWIDGDCENYKTRGGSAKGALPR